jgi:hypothetical protein
MFLFRLNIVKMDVQPPPIRTLDDFVLDSSRFAVRDIPHLERWNNRIINNLLYYQSNYFVSFLTFLGIVGYVSEVVVCCMKPQLMRYILMASFCRQLHGSLDKVYGEINGFLVGFCC